MSSLITCVQLNLAIITVHFNFAMRWRGHSQASFDVGWTNWMPIKNLKEQTNAWCDSFVSQNVFFFAEEWWEQFRISRRSLFKPADEMRVNPHTCGRESSIWIRCVWTWKFLNPERKNCGLKNTQIRVEGTLEECQAYRELTGCHRFSCRPVLLISCVVVRPSCVQKWILLEWLFSVLPFLVFPTQGMQAIADTK